MNNLSEPGASYETPIPRQPSRDTNRPPVRTVLYNDSTHDDGPVPDPIPEDADPDEDLDGFIPIEVNGDADENHSIISAHSNTSPKWATNPDIMANNYSYCRSAIRDLSGGFGHTQDILQSLKLILFNGIPVIKALTAFWRTKNGKTECTNIAAVVAEIEKERPLIFSAVLEVATFTGHHAREKLTTAFDMLYDDSKNHRLIIYAIMCYIWTVHPKSKTRTQLSSIVQDFVLATNEDEVNLLLEACSKGHAMNFPLTSEVNDTDQLPGILRCTLIITMSTQEFEYVTSQWKQLWHCLCNFICKQDFSKEKIGQLDELIKLNDLPLSGNASEAQIRAHPYVNSSHSMQYLHTLMQQAHNKITACALRENKKERIPSNLARIQTFAAAIYAGHPEIWTRIMTLMDDKDLKLDKMTYDEFLRLALRAETRNSATDSVVAFTLSLFKKDKPTPAPKPKPKGGAEAPQESRRAVYIKMGKFTFEGLTGHGVIATDSERKAATAAGKCSNCLGIKAAKFPNHTANQCPFTKPDCSPWDPNHIPITMTDGKTLRESDPELIKPFLAERKSFLANRKAPAKTPTIPPEPQRNVTFQPVQFEEIPDEDPEATDESAISVPPEPPAKGTIRAPTWHDSSGKNLRTHYMMCHSRVQKETEASEESEESEEFLDPSELPPLSDFSVIQPIKLPTVEVFLADIQGTKVQTGVDTFAEVTAIRLSVWNQLSPRPEIQPSQIRLHGVGGSSVSQGFAVLPVRLQAGFRLAMVPAFIMNDNAMPTGVDLLLGIDTQRLLSMELDIANHVIFCQTVRADIFLYDTATLSRRRQCRPLTVFASCSGPSFIYLQLVNLGFTIDKWYASEIDPTCILIAEKLIPAHVYVNVGNILSCASKLDLVHVDLHVSTAPCQPWSSLVHNPLGFDDHRAQAFIASNTIHKRLAFTNPDIQYLVENVRHHRALPDDLNRMTAMWNGLAPIIINASTYGSPSSRPRVIFTDIVTADDLIPRSRRGDPNRFLDDDTHFCPKGTLPCIVATDTHTINPPTVTHRTDGTRRYLSMAEAEVAQGLPQEVTDDLGLSRAQRLKIIGNALNAWMTQAILVHFELPTNRRASTTRYVKVFHSTVHTKPESYPATPEGADTYVELLGSFDDDTLRAYFASQLEHFSLSQLMLELKPGSNPRAKPKPFPVPSGILDAVNYAIDQAIAKGYMKELFHVSHENWVSNMFIQIKKGRFWPGTDKQLVRFLIDLRALNSCLLPSPAHWAFACPDQRSMCQSIPIGTEFMTSCDLSDAFHTAIVHPDSRHLLVGQIAGRYVQYIGGPQGLANMALFWNPHLQEGFYAAISCHWIFLWVVFVDDIGVFGTSKRAVRLRARILSFLLDALKKPHSFGGSKDGTWEMEPQTSMILAGINVTPHGFSIANDQLAVLHHSLTDYKVITKEDAQHVIGVIQYCHSVFTMDSETWKLYSAALHTLMDAANAATTQKSRVIWGEPCKTACSYIDSLITNAPRALWQADTLLDPNHCLVILTDASDTAMACSLFFVKEANARDVTEAMLKDKQKSQLMATKVIRLTPSQKRWATWETEFYAAVIAVETWGNYMTTATSQYPKDPDDKKAKILFLSDSKTAIAKWVTIHVPEGKLDCLCAKKRRFNNWAAIVSHCQYLPMHVEFIPGTNISLPHMMTHMADMIQARIEMDSVLPKMMYPLQIISTRLVPVLMHPARLVSYYNDEVTKSHEQIPPHFFIHLPSFSKEDCLELQRAYQEDNTVYINGIKICEIYCVLAETKMDTVHPTVVKRIRSWQNTLFFVHLLHDVKIILTPASHQAIRHGTNDIPAIDQTNNLVLVAPTNAKVQISSLESICSDAPSQADGMTIFHPADQDANYMNYDLIQDALCFCHQGAHHNSHLQSQANLKAILWFPHMVTRMTAFYDACSHCIPRATTQHAIGNSIRAAQRFYEIIMDHKVLPQELADITDHHGILSICCNACRMVRFLPVRTVNAADAAMKFYTGWIAIFGSPAIVRSDKGSAFISKMMKTFRKMMGVKNWDFSCPKNPTHHALIETRHRDLENVLNTAMDKGDLSAQTIEFYCCVSAQRFNQYIHDAAGYTPHHLTFGETPRHQHNFMMVPTQQEIVNLDLAPMDHEFIKILKNSIRDTIVYVHYKNDERLHKEKAHRLTAEYNKRHTAFEHRVNDIVSYEGEIATVIELLQPTVTGPTKALIRLTNHEGSNDKKVLYSDLLPVGIQYPELMIDIPKCEIAENQFCFFYEPEQNKGQTLNIFAGIIVTANDKTMMCTIHRYQQSTRPKNKFLPLWTQPDGQIFARGKQQKHQLPVHATVSYQDIIVTTILEKDKIPEYVLRSLGNQGAATMHPILRDNNSSSGDFGDNTHVDESDAAFNDSGAHQSWMKRLTNRAAQLRVTPDTLVESLYHIPDIYFAKSLESLDNDHRRSEMVKKDIHTVLHCENRSILESPHPSVIGWAPHPSVQEITLGSGHTYDLPTTPESLRQWLRPMPSRTLPP